MSTTIIKPWVESVILHPGVLSPNFSEDIFALDLGPLADGNKNVPAVYRDPEQFFRASYLTNGLKSLLQDVLSRLSALTKLTANWQSVFEDAAQTPGEKEERKKGQKQLI